MIACAEEFVALRSSRDPKEYLRAATDTASTEVWLEVIERFPEMRIWVAHNKTVPGEVLSVLARDPDPAVRSTVAMKNKLSEELFALLSRDTDDSVRERIAYNKKTPIAILRSLANDACGLVSIPSRERLRSRD
jgi:hypothetical protein